MIDTHCHLEQRDYNKDREIVIKRCKEKLQAIITSCSNPEDFSLTMQLVRKYPGFIFASTSVHPFYAKKINHGEVEEYINKIKTNKKNIVAIGETGLDYNWADDEEWKKKQKRIFERFILLSKKLQFPIVVHSRDSTREAIEILELFGIKNVQMHMFTERSLLSRVIDNGWLISVNTFLLRSKNVKKIVRKCPLERLMLETDAPWLGIGKDGNIEPKNEYRNEPLAVRLVAEKIGEIKKIKIEDVDKQTTENAIKFFRINT